MMMHDGKKNVMHGYLNWVVAGMKLFTCVIVIFININCYNRISFGGSEESTCFG